MLNCAIIGLGGLGKVHLKNMIELTNKDHEVKLVALCDIEPESFTTAVKTNLGDSNAPIDLSSFQLYTDVYELIEKENLDFIINALPTYLHDEISILAMEKGIHVFSEKPMALNLDKAKNMIKKAKELNKHLMIGQCLRFWPEYLKLKELIDSQEYGKVVRAEFLRFSATPAWTWKQWMLDFEKSGGAALDMHVHDVDFIQWAFGMPDSLASRATHAVTKFDSIFTTYHYKDLTVTACGDWGMPSGFKFRASFLVRFEKATVEMKDGEMILYLPDGIKEQINVSKEDAYYNEISEFIRCIRENRTSERISPESTAQSIKLALLEMESANDNEVKYVQ